MLRLYGSTEALVATWNRPDASRDARVHTDGTPMSGRRGRGYRDGARSSSAGPNTCVGFFADPERTAATFDDEGWVRSGDLATLDHRQQLTIVGRKKELIIRGGMNITPRELEDLVNGFAEVATVAVVGTADERLGEVVCACVVLHPGTALDLETVVDAPPRRRRRHLQAPATARGAHRAADHRVGQDPEARDPSSPRGARMTPPESGPLHHPARRRGGH